MSSWAQWSQEGHDRRGMRQPVTDPVLGDAMKEGVAGHLY
jgi:hypothetical protein